MRSMHRRLLLGGALCALVFATTSVSHAATILKLNLGGVSPDVSMSMVGGSLSTVDDLNPGTLGDQDTAIEYTGFLDALFADINTSTASFSLSNLLATGPAQVAPGPVVIQDYQGGSYSLYAPNNALLLSGTLTDSVLTGTLGPPGTGAVITTVLGAVTGGSLEPYVLANSVALSMNLTSINGGAGLTLDPNNMLQPFSADAFVNITADPSHLVPEPASLLLVLAGVALGMTFGGRSANRL